MLSSKAKVQIRSEDTHALLGKNFIAAYLKSKGYTLEDLKRLPEVDAKQLRIEASIYASNKLAEIEQKAQFVTKLHELYDLK